MLKNIFSFKIFSIFLLRLLIQTATSRRDPMLQKKEETERPLNAVDLLDDDDDDDERWSGTSLLPLHLATSKISSTS
jgi:hypothetical protein